MHTFLKKVKGTVLQLIYPRVCPVCGRITAHEESRENPYICKECYPKLNIPEGARCLRCSRPLLDESEELCPDCRRETRWYDQGIGLLLHDDTTKKIIYDLKYSNKRDNADMLGYEAASRFSRLIRHWNPDVVIPVPLHPKKELQRGFNQAAILSARLSESLEEKGLRIPVDRNVLFRTKKTTVQKELNKYQRMANIHGAFEVKGGICPYRRVLLIDDIYTSGATLSEGARVLKEAGAEKVYFLTFSID